MGSKRVKNPEILGKIKTPFWKILGILGTFKNPLPKLADFDLKGGRLRLPNKPDIPISDLSPQSVSEPLVRDPITEILYPNCKKYNIDTSCNF